MDKPLGLSALLLTGRFKKIRRFQDIPDIMQICPACSEVAQHFYGGRHLQLCVKCAVSCGPDVNQLLNQLSEDRLERCVQLGFMQTGCTEFGKMLTGPPDANYTCCEAQSRNEDVRKLLAQMREHLEFMVLQVSNTIQ